MVIKSACPEKPHAAGNPTSLQTMSETEAGSGAGKEGVGLGGGVVVVVVGHGWKGFALRPVSPQKHFMKSKDRLALLLGHLFTMS